MPTSARLSVLVSVHDQAECERTQMHTSSRGSLCIKARALLVAGVNMS